LTTGPMDGLDNRIVFFGDGFLPENIIIPRIGRIQQGEKSFLESQSLVAMILETES
jgi:hypothetical protein